MCRDLKWSEHAIIQGLSAGLSSPIGPYIPFMMKCKTSVGQQQPFFVVDFHIEQLLIYTEKCSTTLRTVQNYLGRKSV